MSSDAQAFRDYIRQQGNPAKTMTGSEYTGSHRVHYGLTVPAMRAFVKSWAAGQDLDAAAWLATLDALYHGESFEEKVFAGLLLAHSKSHRRQLPLAQFDLWLGQLVGWNEVDATCQSVFTAAELLADWQAWDALLSQLAEDANINKRRASLVLLVLPLRESADERLRTRAFANIDRLKDERDKLITKAISWLLRVGIKQHREAIAAYVQTNRDSLPALVVRETLKKLETGRK